jgi:hypothetical protein
MSVKAPFTLSRDDARRFGVCSRGTLFVEDDGRVAVTFTPVDRNFGYGTVVLTLVDYVGFGPAYIASVAPCMIARAVLSEWVARGRVMMCADISLSEDEWRRHEDELELARAAAALGSHGDAVHSKGTPA